MIDLHKPFDDFRIFIEEIEQELTQKKSDIEGEVFLIQDKRAKQQSELKSLEEVRKQVEMEKAFLVKIRDNQTRKEEELKKREDTHKLFVDEENRLSEQRKIEEDEFLRKQLKAQKMLEELEKKRKDITIMEERIKDLELREKMVEKEKEVDRERKELLNAREKQITQQEERIKRLM